MIHPWDVGQSFLSAGRIVSNCARWRLQQQGKIGMMSGRKSTFFASLPLFLPNDRLATWSNLPRSLQRWLLEYLQLLLENEMGREILVQNIEIQA